MFDLEKSIAEWRRQMTKGGITSREALDELESHLRDDLEKQVRDGISLERAFDAAVQRIGRPDALKKEFGKSSIAFEARFAQLMGIACAILAGFFALMILPKLLHHTMGWPATLLGLAAIATSILVWRYGHKFLPAIRHRFARAIMGTLCCVAGISWMMLCIYFLPQFLVRAYEGEMPLDQFFVSFLWILAALAILGGVAYRLEEAAHRDVAAKTS